ncbi:MAG: glycosyltransferase family 39 protein, partial [Candidatus Auribacterota bacterium]|nr:glycosyltransferase family 39 protein [Candidatus Auribacterota bacterium]
MKEKRNILILFFLLVLAASLRIYHLGHASLWLDELATVYGLDAGNPPAYIYLLQGWIKIVGNGEAMVRLPSVILSLLMIPLLYLFGKKLFSAEAGLIAAVLLTISPYNINYAQEVRMYSLVWLLGLISFYFFHQFLKKRSNLPLIICLIANILSIYISYSGFFFIISENIIFLIFYNRSRLKSWISAQLLSIVLLIPLFPLFIEKASHRGGVDWIYLSTKYRDLFRGILCYLGGDLSGVGSPLVYIPFLLLIGIGYFTFQRRSLRLSISPEDIYLWSWFFLPILLGLTISLFFFPFLTPLTIRYIGFVQFPFFLAAGYGISRIRPVQATIILLLLIGLTTFNYLIPYYRDDIRIGREDWRGLIAHLEETVNHDSPVWMMPGTLLPYRYYGTGM